MTEVNEASKEDVPCETDVLNSFGGEGVDLHRN